MRRSTSVVVSLAVVTALLALGVAATSIGTAVAAKRHEKFRVREPGDAEQFKGFLTRNVLPESKMPRSFAVEPPNYFSTVPDSLRPHFYTQSYNIPQCGNESVPPNRMNAYMFQTETLLVGLGLCIYDGAMWCIAMGLLGETDACATYIDHVLVEHKTLQFNNIRADAKCKGVMAWGQCSDPDGVGVCGFCYGDDPATLSLTSDHSYFFHMVSDYWAIQGTIDARCPDRKQEWTWNDYKPILGENVWAIYLGPLHNAMRRNSNKPSFISDSDAAFTLGIPFLDGLEAMKIGDFGGFYYCPRNTWFGFSKDDQNVCSTFSIENQGSLYASLRAFYWVIDGKHDSDHRRHMERIAGFITGLKKFLLSAWDTSFGFFRQGGSYDPKTKQLSWGQNGQPLFAVDCQTWVSSVLGTKTVDGAFGQLTAYNLWQTVKARAGYTCPGGQLCGVGYTDNSISGQVFSGEWTYGAINWLRVMIADSGYNATLIANLQNDIENMLFGLETYLITSTPINNSTESYTSVNYANIRYFIPFGWYANPLPATSSTGWAVAVAKNFNPLNIVGNYSTVDQWVG